MAEVSGFVSFGGTCMSEWARVNSYLSCTGYGKGLPQIVNDYSCPEDWDEEGYGTSPSFEENPAPWYDPTIPASNEFLGFFVSDITGLNGPPYLRSYTVNNSIGSSLSRMKFAGREMTFKGTMYASTTQGMEYGIRWLNQVVLGQSSCDGCPDDEMTIRIHCSRDSVLNPDDGLVTLKRVGNLDPPRYTPATERSGCLVKEATFSMYSELPYLYAQNMSTTTITYDVDGDCVNTWCNDCPPVPPPCAKDTLPDYLIALSESGPPQTWDSVVDYNIGDKVYFGIYEYVALKGNDEEGEANETNINQNPSSSPTYWGISRTVRTWSEVGWHPTTSEFPPVDRHFVVQGSPNVDSTCYITVNADHTFEAVNFDLAAGIPTDCNLVVQNSNQYSGCEDPDFEDIFDALVLTDCACIPPFAITSSAQIDPGGDWVEGTAVIRITTGSGKPLRHHALKFYENTQNFDLPSVDPDSWKCQPNCGGIVIPYLPPNSTLTFDGRSREVTLQCGQSIQSGEKYVYSLDGTLFSWIDLSCVPIVVEGIAHPLFFNEDTEVSIEVWERRL